MNETNEILERNKAVVRDFYDMAFNQQKPADAVAKHVGTTYRQHNPMAPDGSEAFVAFVSSSAKANPKMRLTFKRFVAEGDLVVVHSHMTREPDDRGLALVDIFRLEAGKIVEHWDVIQEVPATAANNNTMF